MAELPQEVLIIVITALVGDILETLRGRQQQVFGKCDAAGDEILMEAHAEQFLVGRTEMPVAQMEIPARFLRIPGLFAVSQLFER